MNFLIACALSIATAFAVPTGDRDITTRGVANTGHLCANDLAARCCAVNVLGVVTLDCETPSEKPTSYDSFKSTCAATRRRAQCCSVDLAGLKLLCTNPLS